MGKLRADGIQLPEPVSLSIEIRYAEVLHFLGYPKGRQPARQMVRRIEDLLDQARGLVEARGAYRHLPIESAGEVGLEPVPARGLVIGLVTAGHGLEDRASELAARGDSTSALLLDAMGSAAAEEAADRLGARIVGDLEASHPSPALSCRISPGYGGWPLEAQRLLFERLPHEELGVALLPSFLMVPRKSVSFAMWLGADARPLAGLSGCDRCGLEFCQYRRSTPSKDGSQE